MRQIVIDTETTGLSPAAGDRIVEIGGVELIDGLATGQQFHCYLNPDRDMPATAQAVHGLTDGFLADKSRFADIAEQLIGFVSGAELVIHNAPFDLSFLNSEMARCGKLPIEVYCSGVVDTLRLARQLRPCARNNLDALCAAYGVSSSHRNHHGALLDAMLLAEVYVQGLMPSAVVTHE